MKLVTVTLHAIVMFAASCASVDTYTERHALTPPTPAHALVVACWVWRAGCAPNRTIKELVTFANKLTRQQEININH